MKVNFNIDAKNELSEFNYRLACGAAMVDAVRELMVNGEYSRKDYEKPLFGAYLYLRSLCDELSGMIGEDRP